nr:MAG TPA: hypothetical protein [Caudoviricetes sp.]
MIPNQCAKVSASRPRSAREHCTGASGIQILGT